jgi:ubiquinone biosynthesis protein UbiJ
LFLDLLLSPIASIINHGIDDHDDAQDLCDGLDGKSLLIVVRSIPKPILIFATDGMIELSTGALHPVDAEITGTIIELNRLLFIDRHTPIRESRVEVVGDLDIADRFRELLLCARPDLEETLANWFGKSLTAQMTSFSRETRDWAADISEHLPERVVDYLQDDNRQLPTRSEITQHFAAVDELADTTVQLEKRFDKLTGKQCT